MRFFLILAIVLCPAIAQGYDAASFDPRPVVVIPKGSGGVPVGTIIAWPSLSNPADMGNWLECNGQSISAAAYPDLYAIVGASVPNYQGLFLRGYGSQNHTKNNGSTVGTTITTHTSGGLGIVQGDTMRSIVGHIQVFHAGIQDSTGVFTSTGKDNPFWGYGSESKAYAGATFDNGTVTPVSGENRPVNMAVRYFIRALP